MSRRQSFDRKIHTIKFVVLSLVLFLICDIIGRWFIPEGYDNSGIWRIIVWFICFAVGGSVYYGLKVLGSRTVKIVSILLFQIVFVILLRLFQFYNYGNVELIGYKIIVSFIPIIAVYLDVYSKRFFHWYGVKVKTLFKLTSVRDIRFLFSIALLLAAIVLVFIGGYKLEGFLSSAGRNIQQLVIEGEINRNKDHYEPVRQYNRIFNDLNDVQIEAAHRNGLRNPIEAADVERNIRLQKIEDCKYYEVDRLTHSMPYLVPKAVRLIEDIGQAFQDSLHNRGYNRNHKITITSVLRTEDHVKNLRRTNVNSSENSCHCYGTTVDISYFSFETPEFGHTATVDKMRQILMQVVYDLRNEGRCYVKYEKQQTCLHITVR
jgi:hypothetical protein